MTVSQLYGTGTIFLILQFICPAACASYAIDDSKGLGRRFDGIGGLSGGGATSKLLVNYPEEQRDQILDYLFKPNFGASLHILKVEIGGDAQSTDGSEASHMHYSWDENYQRGYEWWLMTEAKKRNPDILLYCLPWAFPAWVGHGKRDPYHDPELTASYVVKYILGAKAHYNLTFDYVGIWNERPYNSKYIEVLRKSLDANRLQHVRIVAADGTWEPLAAEIIAFPALREAVDIIGVHYPGTKGSMVANKSGKQLWSSEDYSTFNDNVGAGCWARILNQNYVNGYMTSTISWNLIASYYEALPFARDGLMTADSPWSGYYRVESPIWITAHTTQFSKPGWIYTKHDDGVVLLRGGGSMVTLQSPDKKDFTIIIETMSHDHSKCIRPSLPDYNVTEQNITLKLAGSFAKAPLLYVWYSKLGFDGKESVLLKSLGPEVVKGGIFSLSLGIDEVYTLTTLKSGLKGGYPEPPPVKPFPLPYTDDFESYREFSEPFNLAQQIGTFEVITTTSAHKNIVRQMLIDSPCNWCSAENANKSMNIIGNSSWSDIYVEADAVISPVNGTTGLYIAARINKGGCSSFAADGVFFFVFPHTKTFEVSGDLARTQKLYAGTYNSSQPFDWINMGLLVKNNSAVGTLNNTQVFNISVAKSKSAHGFVGLGTAEYGLADFDNLKINTAEGGLGWMKKKIKYVQASNEKYDDFDSNILYEKLKNKSINSKSEGLDELSYIEEALKENLKITDDEEISVSETLYFKSLKEIRGPANQN